MKLALTFVLLAFASTAWAVDSRICGPDARTPDGKLARSRLQIAEFKRTYACPANGRKFGACPGWAIDHVIPLACGGCDSINNMQWLPNAIKSAPGTLAKDRWERKVYCVKAV